ncbi:MAG: hypothetical protein CVT59_09390 [Actinobacteria bacterium HGW-Actinobacteria-1]|nr:MAG: hypothetical protein CVT59_09390 [Actinobacteria bacterium HGW-Actinobacteria-1]
MSSRPRPSRRWWSMLLCVALVASLSGFTTATGAPSAPAAVPKAANTKVMSGSMDIAGSKMDSRLSDIVAAAKDSASKAKYVDVAVLVAKGSSAPKGLEQGVKIKLRADTANDLWAGRAKAGNLVKMASEKQVTQVFENGRREAPPIPDEPTVSASSRRTSALEAKERLEEARSAGVLDAFAAQFDGSTAITLPGLDDGAATGWWDVGASGHDSAGAWAQGYDGTGVRVAVADDSVDFAHPDLMGTQAVVSDPSSPYYGWPEALDPFSTLLYAYDAIYGTTYVEDGQSWFTDSSATVTEASPAFGGSSDWALTGTSVSGTYHMGYLWDENLDAWWWGYPAVLVVDENTAGVYDTVYVDLDMDHDFNNDKPCTKADPISYLDFWNSEAGTVGQDGYADLSGGMVYWIADGTNQPPGYDFMIGAPVDAPQSGCMVSFMGALDYDSTHGTLCASNVVGQGVIDGPSDAIVDGGSYPPFKTPVGGGAGIVQGAARDADLVAMSDIYWNHFTSTLVAYDYAAFGLDETPGTADDIQCVSNSYGESDEDADEWDYRSRYITFLNTEVNPEVTYLFSTGNGAPGYGTSAPPTPATGIGIGASTQMGACGGWDSILDADQVNVGDVIPWSNRGPSAAGHLGPAVVADGAYSSGALALNQGAGDGWRSWEIWGGTSRSCPVATGNLALVFEAYKDANGSWPAWDTARDLLMNGATDLNYDTLTQGSGMVDASRSVSLAAGNGGLAVSPAVWYPGDYRGDRLVSYVNLMQPGETYNDHITVTNTGAVSANVTISDSWLQLDSVETTTITLTGASESSYNFNRPDVLRDITALVNAADADLMVIKADEPFAQFAPTGSFSTHTSTHNVPRLLVYNWKDQNSNGRLWTDSNTNGFVNAGEIETGEYMRFTYANNFADSQQVRVQRPQDRKLDGVFLGLQHSSRATASPTVVVQISIEFWSRTDQPWLSAGTTDFALGAGASQDVPLSVSVPSDAPVGIYEGEYRVDNGSTVTVVPVHINVAASGTNFEFGDVAGAPESLMPNGKMFGYQDWNWRAESGDWRFFMTDVEETLPEGAVWLVHTDWPDVGAPTAMQADNDTLLFSTTPDEFSDFLPETFGPGTLAASGGSANMNISGGVWLPQTNTGATSEWVAAPIGMGLSQIMIHNVVWPGSVSELSFTGEAGMATVAPSQLDIVDAADSGAATIDFTTSLALSGASAEAYGLSKTFEGTYPISQSTVWVHDVTLTHAAYLEATTSGTDSDVDLYVFDGADNLIGASESSSGDEYVRIDLPADDTYSIQVYGYSVVGGTDNFDVRIASPMGNDLSLSGLPDGAIAADSGFTLDVDWTKVRSGALTDREGTFEGLVVLGPTEAPSAIQVPVSLRYPFEVEYATPTGADTVDTPDPPIVIRFSKRVDPATLSDATVYVTDGTDVLGAELAYTDSTATLELTLDQPLASSTEYTVMIDGVDSVDGDTLSTEWTFSTIDSVMRLAGTDRYKTAIAVSTENWDTSDVVILATGAQFPDALAASSLAGSYDAPLLLTRPDSLLTSVRDEIVRLGASSVIIVGGTSAVSTPVATAVAAIPGVSISRIAGVDRYDTAARVAAQVQSREGDPAIMYVARGDDFADALACSPYAYSNKVPVLLTRTGSLPGYTKSAIEDLGASSVLLAGGTAAVSASVADAIDALPGVSVTRLAGGNRYATAGVIAEDAVARSWASWTNVGIATGLDFPDSLVGGAATGRRGGVLLMTDPMNLSGATRAELLLHGSEILRIDIYGGTSVVSSSVAADLGSLLW